MAERTVDNTPGMRTRARLSDRPSLFLRILQGFANSLVRMLGHLPTHEPIALGCMPLYHWSNSGESRLSRRRQRNLERLQWSFFAITSLHSVALLVHSNHSGLPPPLRESTP